MGQMMVQIRHLQNKVNSLSDAKECYDPETASSIGATHVPQHSSQGESQLYIFEDNEAVIKMIIKDRSPTMRHVTRNHRVALDWLFDRINLEHKIQIKYVFIRN